MQQFQEYGNHLRTAMKSLTRHFLQLFLPASMLVVVGGWFYGHAELDSQLATGLFSQETINVGRGAGAITGVIDSINRDLKFLSNHSALRAIVNDLRPQTRAHLEEDFANFSGSKLIYDQLRWIDETGMEIVRVDFDKNRPVIVSPDKLQNKGKRYFFTDSFKLNPGEVFMSPLDLNVEQNVIETPYKPMLRLATPVVDHRGVKRGIVILNYNGKELLRAFGEATSLRSTRTSHNWELCITAMKRHWCVAEVAA